MTSQCPTCRIKMDRNVPIQNRAIQQLIEKFTCRCPTTSSCSSSAAGATATAAGKSPKNKRARIHNSSSSSSSSSSSCSSSAPSVFAPADDMCTWQGPFGTLEDHLAQCGHVEIPCAFKSFGCNVKLPRAAMEAHQVSDAQVHSSMMADKITKLEAKVRR